MSIIRGIWRVSGRSPVSDKPRHNISIILAMNQAIEKTLSTWQVDIASNRSPDGRCLTTRYTRTTIFPFAPLDSIRRCASRISLNSNTFDGLALYVPSTTRSTMS